MAGLTLRGNPTIIIAPSCLGESSLSHQGRRLSWRMWRPILAYLGRFLKLDPLIVSARSPLGESGLSHQGRRLYWRGWRLVMASLLLRRSMKRNLSIAPASSSFV